jgi:hypothetical protein
LSGMLSSGWILIFFGYILLIIGDLWYAINYETYVTGNFIDMSWNIGFLLFFYAFSQFKKTHDEVTSSAIQLLKANKLKKKTS